MYLCWNAACKKCLFFTFYWNLLRNSWDARQKYWMWDFFYKHIIYKYHLLSIHHRLGFVKNPSPTHTESTLIDRNRSMEPFKKYMHSKWLIFDPPLCLLYKYPLSYVHFFINPPIKRKSIHIVQCTWRGRGACISVHCALVKWIHLCTRGGREGSNSRCLCLFLPCFVFQCKYKLLKLLKL